MLIRAHCGRITVAFLSVALALAATVVCAPAASASPSCEDGSRAAAKASRDTVDVGRVVADDQFPATVTLRYSPGGHCAWALVTGRTGGRTWVDRQAEEATIWAGPLGERAIRPGNDSTYTAAFTAGGAKVRACAAGFHQDALSGLLGRGPIACTDWFDDATAPTDRIASTSHGTYTALGDSYGSGEGAESFLPGTDHDGTGCHRSSTAWGFDVARSAGTTVDLAACSGATVRDLYGYNADNAGEPPQLRAVDPARTTLATLSIGGNDVGFSGILRRCVTGVKSDGRTGCSEKEEGRARQALDALVHGSAEHPALSQVYVDMAGRLAPGGKLVVVGYPNLFGRSFITEPNGSGWCQLGTAGGTLTYKVDRDDAAWMNARAAELETALADAVDTARQALVAAGRPDVSIVFAPVSDAFAGHRLCDEGKAWINGVQFGGIVPQPQQTSFHPNASGQEAYGRAVSARL